jgi:PadR family transcriptional regulator PadR
MLLEVRRIAALGSGGVAHKQTHYLAIPCTLVYKVPGMSMDPMDNWAVQVRKGVLELAILNAIGARRRYGYDMVKELVDSPVLGVTEGTVYPLLSRLRGQGLIATELEESSEGPARKYYVLSRAGRKTLDRMNAHFDQLVSDIAQRRLSWPASSEKKK